MEESGYGMRRPHGRTGISQAFVDVTIQTMVPEASFKYSHRLRVYVSITVKNRLKLKILNDSSDNWPGKITTDN